MKKHLFTLICIMSINIANAQNVNIPDAIFKSRLVNNPAINTNGDAEIQVSEAAAFSGVINVSTTWPSPAISDLTGIEAFTALTGLDCSGNALSSLDVSSNTALTTLNCSVNQLTSLDVSANTALTTLNCRINQLTNLNISTNTVLTFLFCGDNALTSLDVSANTALTVLSCYDNQLTSLDVSANTALTGLVCSNNQLASLDVSTNTALTSLGCGNNSITSLDVSANTALTTLDCGYSSLTSLDVSSNWALVYLYCLNNQLTSLNVQNGNNVNFTNFNATNNPNLTCIQVDNVGYSNFNWSTGKDSTASYSTNCNAQCTSSQGPDSGSVFVNVPTMSSTPWSQPQQAQSSDNSHASVSLGMGPSRSSRLQATGFGFSIPTTASICGIELKVERSCSNGGARDYEIRLVKNDTVTGANYAFIGSHYWNATDSVVTYGSNSDLWGTSWTPSEINDSSFGAAVSAFHIIITGVTAWVDQITIKVFYDNSTGIVDNTAVNDPITVFPNPSNGNFTITFPDIINKGSIEIYSALGERIFSEPVSLNSKKEINLNNISRGIYFVKVYEGEKYYCKKIIVEQN